MDFERRRELLDLIGDVAEALPGQWDLKPFPEDWGRIGAWLTNPQNQAHLSIGEAQSSSASGLERLDITTDYPKDRNGGSAYDPRPKITVSCTKTGSQIARDIERRLFPEYLPLLKTVLARYSAHDNAEDKSSLLARKIAHVVRVKHDPKSETVSFYRSPCAIFKGTLSQASVAGDDDVELTLRLDATTALRLLNRLTTGRFDDPDLSDIAADDAFDLNR
jgi:hypothetical protein